MRKHILALGKDPTIQHSLWQAFGKEVDVRYNNGTQSLLNLVGNVPPDVILADIKLLKNSDLSSQIKRDDRVAGVPLLLLANENEIVSDRKLADWGAAGIISQPVDIEELKLRVGNFLDKYAIPSDLHEINLDEFRLDNLDQELLNLNKRANASGTEAYYGKNEISTCELDQILAEIDEVPTKNKEGGVKMKEEGLHYLRRATESKEYQDEEENYAAYQEPDTSELAMEKTAKKFTQDKGHAAASFTSGNDSIEQWLRSIAEEKITMAIANENVGQLIEKIARSVVPRIAEELVNREIERIKKKIAGE